MGFGEDVSPEHSDFVVTFPGWKEALREADMTLPPDRSVGAGGGNKTDWDKLVRPALHHCFIPEFPASCPV